MNRLQLGGLRTRRWYPRTTSLNLSARYPQRSSADDFEPNTTTTTHFDTLATVPASASIQTPISESGVRVASVPADPQGRIVLGVPIPQKPPPPAADECCQSGCALCVYDIYLEDMQTFHEHIANVKQEILSRASKDKHQFTTEEWPVDELGPLEDAMAMAQGDSTSDPLDAKVQAEKELERTRSQLDPALRAFLEMEARLKKKEQERQAAAS